MTMIVSPLRDALPGSAMPSLAPGFQVQVDLDERAFLFPAGKALTRLAMGAAGRVVTLDAVFGFNQAHTPPRLLALDVADARAFGHALVAAVYQARTQHAITETMRITIDVLANGYRVQIGDVNAPVELFLGLGCIWRVCQGLLRAVDHVAPNESH